MGAKYRVIAPGGEIVGERIITIGNMEHIQGELNEKRISHIFDSTDGNNTNNQQQYMLIFRLNQLTERGQEETIKQRNYPPMDKETIEYCLGKLGLDSLEQLKELDVATGEEQNGR